MTTHLNESCVQQQVLFVWRALVARMMGAEVGFYERVLGRRYGMVRRAGETLHRMSFLLMVYLDVSVSLVTFGIPGERMLLE